MDNVTHTLSALVLARAGLERLGPGTTAALVAASNAPDLDIVTSIHGTAAYLAYHRGFTHSVAGGALIALGIALVVRLLVEGSSLRRLLLACFGGTALHIVMDLWTSYGTRALLPFDSLWYAWDLVFIVDPWILATLALALFGFGRPAGWRRPAAAVAIVLITAYVLARAGLHHRALEMARSRLATEPVVRMSAIPTPLNPLRWRLLADTGDAYRVGGVDVASGEVSLNRRVKPPRSPLVELVRQRSTVARTFLDFSPYPWLEVQPRDGGTAVAWSDLRFERPNRPRFVARVFVDTSGRIVSESFAF